MADDTGSKLVTLEDLKAAMSLGGGGGDTFNFTELENTNVSLVEESGPNGYNEIRIKLSDEYKEQPGYYYIEILCSVYNGTSSFSGSYYVFFENIYHVTAKAYRPLIIKTSRIINYKFVKGETIISELFPISTGPSYNYPMRFNLVINDKIANSDESDYTTKYLRVGKFYKIS